MQLNTIILGNCIDVLKTIPDNSVDLAFADPSFNLNKKYSMCQDKRDADEYLTWCYQWLDEMVRITKETGSIMVHNIPRWLTYYSVHLNEKAEFKHWISWNALGGLLGKTLLPSHYGILYYVKSKTKYKFYDIRIPHVMCRKCNEFYKDYGGKKDTIHPYGTIANDVWTDIYRIKHNNRRDEHPCQLPEPLLERLILMTTDEGDVVLDPFMGTGTTAIAAKRMGRNYIGIDMDEKYVKIAESKLKHIRLSTINGCFVSVFLDKVVTIRDKDFLLLKDSLKCDGNRVIIKPNAGQTTLSFE